LCVSKQLQQASIAWLSQSHSLLQVVCCISAVSCTHFDCDAFNSLSLPKAAADENTIVMLSMHVISRGFCC